MEREINKKLRNMTKSQLEKVCDKMRCPKGTRKEMVIRLLRPLMKYKMDKIPSELIRDYIGKSGGRQDVGRLATTSKRDQKRFITRIGTKTFSCYRSNIKRSCKGVFKR